MISAMGVAAALAAAVNVLLVDWINNAVTKLTPIAVEVRVVVPLPL